MNKSIKSIAVASIVGVVLGATLLPTKVLAWHPVGKITKYVANETTGSPSVDANTAAAAVSAKPGDILRYTITVRNDGKPADKDYNDLAFVVINDTLPGGVELVGNTGQRVIKENIPGTLKPGKSFTKEYKVKVTSVKDGETIKNTACFTGDSTVKDNKQQGCDDAYTKIKIEKKPEPTKPEQPKPPVVTRITEQPKQTPKETKAPEIPATLPETGPGAIIGSLVGMSAVGYAALNYRRSQKALTNILNK